MESIGLKLRCIDLDEEEEADAIVMVRVIRVER